MMPRPTYRPPVGARSGYAQWLRRQSAVSFVFTAPKGAGGLVYRHVDDNNYWHAYVHRQDHELRLDKVVAGVRTNVATVAVSVLVGELRVIVQGNRHRVWWNRVRWIDETDSALNTATKWGVVSENGASGGLAFDDPYAEGL